MEHLAEVFPHDVEFQIDHATRDNAAEIRMVASIGDDGHTEAVHAGVAYGQAHAIDAYGSFLHCHIALASHLLVELVFERIVVAAAGFFHSGTYSRLIYVSLHDVPIESAAHHHASFQIDEIAYLEESEVGAFEGFAYGGHGIGGVRLADYGEAYAVVCDALVYLEFTDERARHRDVQIVIFVTEIRHLGIFFYDSGKHIVVVLN